MTDANTIFTLERSDYGHRADGSLDLDLYRLRFKDLSLRIVKTTEHLLGSNGSPPRPQTGQPFHATSTEYRPARLPRWYRHYILYAFPAGPQTTLSLHNVEVTVNTQPGQMYALRASLNSGSRINIKNVETYWIITDQNNKEYKIRLVPADKGNTIQLASYP